GGAYGHGAASPGPIPSGRWGAEADGLLATGGGTSLSFDLPLTGSFEFEAEVFGAGAAGATVSYGGWAGVEAANPPVNFPASAGGPPAAPDFAPAGSPLRRYGVAGGPGPGAL